MTILRSLLVALVLFTCIPAPARGAGQVIETVGVYLVGDGETMAVGMERARQAAIQQAAEQAGALVRSYSKVRNMALEEDVIEVVANHAMKITTLPEKRELVGNAVRIEVPIRAEIMEGDIERSLEQAMKQQDEVAAFHQLKEDFRRQSQELERLKKELATATEREKARVLTRIGENERAFTARTLVEEGNDLAAHLQFHEARAKFTKAIELDPRLALAYAGRAEASLIDGDDAEILRDVSTAIGIEPDNPYFYALRGELVAARHCHGSRKDRCSEAIGDLRHAVSLAPNLPQFHQALGAVYATIGKPDEAAAEYDLSLQRLTPATPPMVVLNAHLGRAEFYLKSGGPAYMEKALADLDRSVAIITGPAYLPADYATYLHLIEKKPKNEAEALEAISAVVGRKVTSLAEFQKTEEFRKLSRVLRARNDVALMLWKRSQVRHEAGDIRGANADREECCRFAGEGASIVDRNGFILDADFCAPSGEYRPFASAAALSAYQHLQLGIRAEEGLDHQRAEREFTAAIESDPACFDAYLQRGFLYMNTRALAKARADYDRAVAIDPASSRAHEERGMVRERGRDYQGAVADFTEALRLAPAEAGPLIKRADAYEALHEPEKAVADYLAYARRNTANPGLMLNAAQELRRMARPVEERRVLEDYLAAVREEAKTDPGNDAEGVAEAKERLRELGAAR